MREWGVLIALVAVCLGVGAAGGLVTARAVPEWYAALRKPAWTPPAAAFGPVWTALYVAMAVAAWLAWRSAGPGRGAALLCLFAVQLLLNAAWTPIFFGLRLPGAAFVEILFLWVAIGATTVAFWRSNLLAGALMLPYWAWVSFAAALNFAIWRLNP